MALHFEHCKNFAFSDWTFWQPLHRRDLLLLLSTIPRPVGIVVNHFPVDYPGSRYGNIPEPHAPSHHKQSNDYIHLLFPSACNSDNPNLYDLADNHAHGPCRMVHAS